MHENTTTFSKGISFVNAMCVSAHDRFGWPTIFGNQQTMCEPSNTNTSHTPTIFMHNLKWKMRDLIENKLNENKKKTHSAVSKHLHINLN